LQLARHPLQTAESEQVAADATRGL
jgi:hypothetical protein